MISLGPGTRQTLLIILVALVAIFFFWSRIDFSQHIYYFGDGNLIVELIRLILSTNDWDPNWVRLKDILIIQPELQPLINIPQEVDIFYNLSGHTLVAAAICKSFYAIGFTEWPIQSVLRGFNVTLQLATLFLLFVTGKKLLNRNAGILAAILYVIFPLVVMEAHYERPEVWLCFLLTAVLYCCACFYQAPLRYGVLTGVLIGLSVGTKVNQVFLLALPGLLLIHLWFSTGKYTVPHITKNIFVPGLLIFFCMMLAIVIHTPFLVTHATEVLDGLKYQVVFYGSSSYPYSEESYSFIGQLFVSFRYFQFSLGNTWCLFLLAGVIILIREYLQEPRSNKIINLVLLLPVFILLVFSASLTAFTERALSSLEGALCLITAVGFVSGAQQLQKMPLTKKWAPALICVLFLLTIYTPLRIDYLFVDRYIKHPDKPQRAVFQEILKKDFHKFWIKNVYFSHKVLSQLPEKPEKAPRIYQVDDLNEHWTKSYLFLLEQNGFRKVGTYCSEFSDQPPNTLTIYHAAAKNHYYVRIDEWPADVPTGYFKTNCQ